MRFNQRLTWVAIWTIGAGCQPLPEIEATIHPAEPASISDLVVRTLVQGESGAEDEMRRSYSFEYVWFKDDERVDELTADFVQRDWTTRGQTWTVEVTPVWGARRGTPKTATAVIQNSVPTVAVSIEPQNPGSHQDLIVVADQQDPDGDPLTLSYEWSLNGEVQASLVESFVSAESTSMGDVWSVSVASHDGQISGAQATAETEVGNGAPSVSSVALRFFDGADPDTEVEVLAAGISVEAVADTFDPEGDAVEVGYLWFVDGKAISTEPANTLDSSYLMKGNQVAVEVIASDGNLSGETFVSETVVVENTLPVIDSTQLVPGVIQEETIASCTGVGWLDSDGDAPGAYFDWEVNGTPIGLDSETIEGSFFDKGDILRCHYEPFDGDGTGVGVWSQNVVVANTPPVLASSAITPTLPTKADTLHVDLSTATDVDGDPLTAQVVWYLDGKAASNASSLDLSDINYVKGQEIYATVAPYDGVDLGVAVTAAPVTIMNALPEILSLSIIPDPLFTADIANADVSVADIDGDAVTLSYSWLVNGVEVASSATLDGTIYFDKGDSLTVQVTPMDSDAGLVSVSTPVVVANSPPAGLTTTLTPDRPIENLDDLLCEVTEDAVDADAGDVVQYSVEWQVNSSAFTGSTTTTITGDTISASDTVGKDVWECIVTPSDGVDDGDSVSQFVTVSEPWDMIAAGGLHSCGLLPSGAVECWGDDADGQSSPPSTVFDQVETGGFHSCGITSSSVSCWGRDSDKQVSNTPSTGTYVEVRLGLKHSCARTTAGALTCWGRALNGSTTPPTGSYDSFAVGEYHGCALDSTGAVSCWGRNVNGEATAPSSPSFSSLAAGASHTCGVVASTGALDCWGSTTNGATSHPSGTGYTDLACGKYHCCAIDSTGALDCWGDNSQGQGTPPTSTSFLGVTAGRYHTCAWTSSGYATCWGQDSFGQASIP